MCETFVFHSIGHFRLPHATSFPKLYTCPELRKTATDLTAEINAKKDAKSDLSHGQPTRARFSYHPVTQLPYLKWKTYNPATTK